MTIAFIGCCADRDLSAAGLPSVPREPQQIDDAGNADRHSQRFQPQQQAHARQAHHCPERVAHQRAQLHGQCRTEAAANALANRFSEDGTWCGVEHQAEDERRDEQRQHVIFKREHFDASAAR